MKKIEIMPGCKVALCCHVCAKAFSAENHRLMGLPDKDLYNRLISEHGFNHPTGKPADSRRLDCMVKVMAERLAPVFNKQMPEFSQ